MTGIIAIAQGDFVLYYLEDSCVGKISLLQKWRKKLTGRDAHHLEIV
jgi:hypothetical protein